MFDDLTGSEKVRVRVEIFSFEIERERERKRESGGLSFKREKERWTCVRVCISYFPLPLRLRDAVSKISPS